MSYFESVDIVSHLKLLILYWILFFLAFSVIQGFSGVAIVTSAILGIIFAVVITVATKVVTW